MNAAPQLHVVNYHYVRDLARSRFPRIKGLDLAAFTAQVDQLQSRFHMATLAEALQFLRGEYQGSRDLCLLTFDDGLKEHAQLVTPLLAARGVQGLFFITTACVEEQVVLAVHKNHFLMASLDFTEYRQAFLATLAEVSPEVNPEVEPARAAATYRFDTPDVAALKLLLNFHLTVETRERVLDRLFATFLGDERSFAAELYVSWEEARAMQRAGMIVGGHSHRHIPLPSLGEQGQRDDLRMSTALLRERLHDQPWLTFSYPYGNPVASFNEGTIATLRELEYTCAFTTQVGPNSASQDWFWLQRFDTVDIKL
jgi:peptidoglycan/xylan/chitin deacetylase (PgdA/CDA1 family)